MKLGDCCWLKAGFCSKKAEKKNERKFYSLRRMNMLVVPQRVERNVFVCI